MDYKIDYNDERFKNIEKEKTTAVNNLNSQYDNMINQSKDYYDKQIQAVDDYQKQQTELLKEQTEYEQSVINQNKEKAQRDYETEQRATYSDYVKNLQSAGAQNNQLGLQNSGYSESNRAYLYSAYQGRLATAKQTITDAITQYDNQMTQVKLQNNSKLAEIAYNALQNKLELSLQGFQYKNQLLNEKMDKQMQYDQYYYGKYQDVLSQINQENALAEQIRQYNEKMAEEKRQYDSDLAFKKKQAAQEQANWEKQYKLAKKSSTVNNNPIGSINDNKTVNTNNDKIMLSSTATPIITGMLNNSKIREWYTTNFKNNMTLSDLNNAIAKGINSKYLSTTTNDIYKIYKAYGFSDNDAKQMAQSVK